MSKYTVEFIRITKTPCTATVEAKDYHDAVSKVQEGDFDISPYENTHLSVKNKVKNVKTLITDVDGDVIGRWSEVSNTFVIYGTVCEYITRLYDPTEDKEQTIYIVKNPVTKMVYFIKNNILFIERTFAGLL